jgi:hypothetical protein
MESSEARGRGCRRSARSGGIGEAVEVDGVLRGRRWRRAPGEAVKVEGEAIEWRRGRSG